MSKSRSTYVYLNTYANGYLYVGSHTWDGPEGQLDPNYHGTSHVAMKYGWVPVKEEILEVVKEDRKFVAEREWIEKYAKLYGIADCARVLRMNKFTNSFKRSGLMLNLHSNSAENATAAAAEKIKTCGKTDLQLKHNKEWVSTATECARDPEVRLKIRTSKRLKARKCILSDGFIGNVPEIIEHTGLPKGSICSKVSMAYRYGYSKLFDIEFRPYQEIDYVDTREG